MSEITKANSDPTIILAQSETRRLWGEVPQRVENIPIPEIWKEKLIAIEKITILYKTMGGWTEKDLRKNHPRLMIREDLKNKYGLCGYEWYAMIRRGLYYEIKFYQSNFQKKYKRKITDILEEAKQRKITSIQKLLRWDSRWFYDKWFREMFHKAYINNDSKAPLLTIASIDRDFTEAFRDCFGRDEFAKPSIRKHKGLELIRLNLACKGINPLIDSEFKKGKLVKRELTYEQFLRKLQDQNLVDDTLSDMSQFHKMLKKMGMDKESLKTMDR